MTYHPYVLPDIQLRGAPFEIGKQYGELARERVLLHFYNQKAVVSRKRPEHPDWWRGDEVRRYLPPYEALAPHFVEEMEGLAEATDLTFEEVLLINVRDELLASLDTGQEEHCTSFGCSGAVTIHGQPILGQTKDTAALSKDLYVVAAFYQQGRPDMLQMPYAGEYGVIGFSSSGMAVFANSLYVKGRPRGGIPISLFRRLVLEADTIDDVTALIETQGLAIAGNLTIGDRTGRVICFENTPSGFAVLEGEDGILSHANHVNATQLQHDEDYSEPERSASHQRQERLTQQLNEERGRITAPLALRCLADHTNYPRSICRHPVPGHDSQTTAAIVVEPTRGLLHAVRGWPCRGWPTTYSL